VALGADVAPGDSACAGRSGGAISETSACDQGGQAAAGRHVCADDHPPSHRQRAVGGQRAGALPACVACEAAGPATARERAAGYAAPVVQRKSEEKPSGQLLPLVKRVIAQARAGWRGRRWPRARRCSACLSHIAVAFDHPPNLVAGERGMHSTAGDGSRDHRRVEVFLSSVKESHG